MVVVGHEIDAVAVEAFAHGFEEPVIVGAVKVFDAVQLVAVAPRCCTAATGFLCDGEGYAVVEGSAEEGHLAGV